MAFDEVSLFKAFDSLADGDGRAELESRC